MNEIEVKRKICDNFMKHCSKIPLGEEITLRKLEENSILKGECFLCGGEVRMFSHGEASWSIECLDCGYLYDED